MFGLSPEEMMTFILCLQDELVSSKLLLCFTNLLSTQVPVLEQSHFYPSLVVFYLNL